MRSLQKGLKLLWRKIKRSPNFILPSHVSINGAYVSITLLIYPKPYTYVKNPMFGNITTRLRTYKVFF